MSLIRHFLMQKKRLQFYTTNLLFAATIVSIFYSEFVLADSINPRFLSGDPQILTPDRCLQYAHENQTSHPVQNAEPLILINFSNPTEELHTSVSIIPKSEFILAIYFINNYTGMNEIFSLLLISDPFMALTTYDQITPKRQASCEIMHLKEGHHLTIGRNWFQVSVIKRNIEYPADIQFLSTKTIHLKPAVIKNL